MDLDAIARWLGYTDYEDAKQWLGFDPAPSKIDKRLCALEMWTHKPVPVLTVDAFGRALRRVFDGYRPEDWRSKMLKSLAESAGVDVSRW